MKPIHPYFFIVCLLLSFGAAADVTPIEKFSFFTTHQQRLKIEAKIKPRKTHVVEEISSLGHIQSKRGIRLLLSNKSSLRVKQRSLNQLPVDREVITIDVIKSIQ